ncbi:MAG: ion transporter [Aureispira sp.]|nr:ion transporter [Aureispira sp.]
MASKEIPVERQTGLRWQLYKIVDNDNEHHQNRASHYFELVITVLIIMSILSVILESFQGLSTRFGWYFETFEQVTVIIFIGEYVMRVLTADFKYPDCPNWFSAAWKFIKSGGGIIDLLAISPFLLGNSGLIPPGSDLRFIRMLKITRLFRLFKLGKLTRSIILIGDVFGEKRLELGITMFVTFILLLVSASLMYFVEGGPNGAQPEAFPNIIASFWWAVATLTTVGYGDVFPITPIGKILSGVIAILGIGLVALPAGILSSAFVEKLEAIEKFSEELSVRKKDEPKEEELVVDPIPVIAQGHEHKNCHSKFGQPFVYCPYCGEKMDDGTHDH